MQALTKQYKYGKHFVVEVAVRAKFSLTIVAFLHLIKFTSVGKNFVFLLQWWATEKGFQLEKLLKIDRSGQTKVFNLANHEI